MLRRIRASTAGEAVIALVLVGLAGGIAYALREIFELPALFAGAFFRLRTALAAAWLACLVYDFILEGRSLPTRGGAADDVLTLLIFILAALLAGVSTRALRESRRRAASWSRTMRALTDSTAFFAVTPNEDAIRQRLAQTVSALTKAGAVVTDGQGHLRFRAGVGADWAGDVEGELEGLAWTMIREIPDRIVSQGGFRARLIRSPDAVLGALIWRRPRRDGNHASDEHIELLVELASAAIIRARRDNRVQTRAS
jgi:hypothetical protein